MKWCRPTPVIVINFFHPLCCHDIIWFCVMWCGMPVWSAVQIWSPVHIWSVYMRTIKDVQSRAMCQFECTLYIHIVYEFMGIPVCLRYHGGSVHCPHGWARHYLDHWHSTGYRRLTLSSHCDVILMKLLFCEWFAYDLSISGVSLSLYWKLRKYKMAAKMAAEKWKTVSNRQFFLKSLM